MAAGYALAGTAQRPGHVVRPDRPGARTL